MDYSVNLSVEAPTEKTVNGRDFLVVPTIAVQAQVLNGEFLPAEEIEKSLFQWNGVPLTIEHPTNNDGETISARKTEAFEKHQVGHIREADMVDNKLRVEAWIDVDVAEELEKGEQILERARNGEAIEVSTGYFSETESEQGTINGEEYNATQKNIIPDHLALLPNQVGACSLEDGCGTHKTNESEDDKQTEENKQNTSDSDSNKEISEEETNMEENEEEIKSFIEHLKGFFQSEVAEEEATENEEETEEEIEDNEQNDSEEPTENEDEEEVSGDVELTECEEKLQEKYGLDANELSEAAELYVQRREEQAEQREDLIENLAEDEACKLGEEDLQELSLNQLEGIHESISDSEEEQEVDHSAKNLNENESEAGEEVPEMPAVH